MPALAVTPRKFAIAIPARNEEDHLPACLSAIDRAAGNSGSDVSVFVLANNCTDRTVELLEAFAPRHMRLRWTAASLLPDARHAGWARRLALDGAAMLLGNPSDILATTDADTIVAPDWVTRTVAHLDKGMDVVAGRVFTRKDDRIGLGAEASRRLNLLERYCIAIEWLRADMMPEPHDPWPRHYYEGGASIAMTLGLYERIGGAPTPSIGEDKALVAAAREKGARIRHPLDVRVFTSSRTVGRAPGGVADVFAQWIGQSQGDPLHEIYRLDVALDPDSARDEDRLSFLTLPDAIGEAVGMIRARRAVPATLCAARPQACAWSEEARTASRP